MITRMLYGADPLRNMRRLQDEMNRLQERGPTRAPEYPAVNVFANQDGVILTAELAGSEIRRPRYFDSSGFRHAERRPAYRN